MHGGFDKGRALAVALIIGTAVTAGGAWAHDTAGEKPTTPGARAALARHDNAERLGEAFKTINDELKKGQPNRALIARNAQTVHALGEQIPPGFPRAAARRPGRRARPGPRSGPTPPASAPRRRICGPRRPSCSRSPPAANSAR